MQLKLEVLYNKQIFIESCQHIFVRSITKIPDIIRVL